MKNYFSPPVLHFIQYKFNHFLSIKESEKKVTYFFKTKSKNENSFYTFIQYTQIFKNLG